VSLWVKAWASFVLVLCGFYWVPVKGWANMKAAHASRAIVIFNHESYVDPLVLGALLPPSGVAKAGVAEIPFIGLFAHALQFLFVERRGSGDAPNRFTLRTDPVAAIAARAADARFPLVMVAPEATTKSQRCLLRFRRGAFAPGRPVVPVLLRYSYRHFNPGWGVEYSTPLHVWRLLSQPVNFLCVEVLPVYLPSPEECSNPGLYAANVRRVMARRLGVPMVERGIGEERELLARGIAPNVWGCKVVIPKGRG
jgi:lysophosphatidylcholine acyltransferase/lyso-PAF acetyltransferase